MNYFLFEDNKLVLNKETILLIKEFDKLWELDRNKIPGDAKGTQRRRAFKEFTYMYLMYDWESPYKAFSDKDRHETSLSDSELTQEQLLDEDFKLACRKYCSIQETRMLKLLNGMYKTIDELTLFLSTVDLQERDIDGKPIFNAKQISDTIAGVGKTVTSLETVEAIVRREKEGDAAKLRGDRKPGTFD
jgi:hypothetical protein